MRPLKSVKTLRHFCYYHFLMDFEKNAKRNEFGGRFIDIGLEHVAVAAARVVE